LLGTNFDKTTYLFKQTQRFKIKSLVFETNIQTGLFNIYKKTNET